MLKYMPKNPIPCNQTSEDQNNSVRVCYMLAKAQCKYLLILFDIKLNMGKSNIKSTFLNVT